MKLLEGIKRLFSITDEFPASSHTKHVTPRHPTKKGPGRSKGSDPMSADKKKFGTSRKIPKNIPKGMDTGIGVNGIRGKSGGGR